MKKKLAVLLAVGMSTVLLTGCASLIRAMYGSNTNTQNQPITTTTTTTTTTTSESFEPWVTSEPESESESEPSTGSTLVGVTPEYTTATYLSTEAENIIKSLNTDYSKINWGVRYSPDGMDGLVISVSPYFDEAGSCYLVVAFTNIYDKPIDVSASGYAKGNGGTNIGSVYMNVKALGPGNTYVGKVFCSDMPNGEIHWDYIKPDFSEKEYVTWEADYTGSAGSISMDVEVNLTCKEAAEVNQISVVTVDTKGNVTDCNSFYPPSGSSTNYNAKISLYGMAKTTPGDACIFANPVK